MLARDFSCPYDSGQWRDDTQGSYLEWCGIMRARLRIVRALAARGRG
jgi:hypothetical protein